MQLIDKTGLKYLAYYILNKVAKGFEITGDFVVQGYLNVKSMSFFKKGIGGTYVRFLDPWVSEAERNKKFMYINYNGDQLRVSSGKDLYEDGTFTYVEEMMSIDYDDNGYLAVGRHLVPKKNSESYLGTKNYRWNTVYCVNALNTSSEKYKTNIEYIENNSSLTKDLKEDDKITTNDMYEFVKDIPLASFDYSVGKEREKEDRALGFIAEDIMNSKVGKAFVFDTEEGALYNPTSYSTVLYGAVKQLIARVECLESQLASKEA